MRRRSDYPAYLAMRVGGAAILALPRVAGLAAGATLGRLARLVGLRRRVTDANLARAFPELDPARRNELAGRVYAHFGRMAVDSLRLAAGGPASVVPLVTGGECVQLLRDRLPRGRGAIVLTGHVGNWELAGAYIAASGFELAAIVKPPANPWIARHAEHVRRQLGIETIALPDAPSAVLEALRRNKVVALVADQGALRSTTWTPFFGVPTKTPAGPGIFALRSGAPVLFGAMLAQRDGSYHLEGEVLAEEVSGEAGDAAERMGRLFRTALERVVRRAPEQYLWTHRLWKQAPPTPAPAALPPDAP